jgi:hypothetical protein
MTGLFAKASGGVSPNGDDEAYGWKAVVPRTAEAL